MYLHYTMGGYALAEYQWNALLLRHVFILPEEVADKHLRLAGAVQLKVLLWLSRHGGIYEDDACSCAVGASAPDCRDALRYWMEAGVLQGVPEATVTLPVAEPVSVPAITEVAKAPLARPRAVKPQMPEVIARRERDAEFAYLLDEVSARMGRPLSPGDMETLLYLCDTAGLPAGVVLMVVGYAASADRLTMRYIEKVALDWADRDIVTMAAAEEHLCRLERSQQALTHVQKVCGLDKPPTGASAFAAAEKWVYDWQLSDELLRRAYDICLQKTGKFHVGYMNRVLENWHEQGVDTPEKAEALSVGGKKSSTSAETESEYEAMVEQYIPVYKKKKKG